MGTYKRFRTVFSTRPALISAAERFFSSRPALMSTAERFFLFSLKLRGVHFQKWSQLGGFFFTLFSTGFFAVAFSSAKKKSGSIRIITGFLSFCHL